MRWRDALAVLPDAAPRAAARPLDEAEADLVLLPRVAALAVLAIVNSCFTGAVLLRGRPRRPADNERPSSRFRSGFGNLATAGARRTL